MAEREQNPSKLERLNALSDDSQKKLFVALGLGVIALEMYGINTKDAAVLLPSVAGTLGLGYLAARYLYEKRDKIFI